MRLHLTLFSLFIAAGVLYAQPKNILLSVDPIVPVLPEDIQIQDAASLGDTWLVVWGSTRIDGGGEIHTVLYGQIVEDGGPIGVPEIITDKGAEPFGFVAVSPANDHFRIFWNDRRNGTTTSASIGTCSNSPNMPA